MARTKSSNVIVPCCGNQTVKNFLLNPSSAGPVVESVILLEDGTNLLLENGTNILLE